MLKDFHKALSGLAKLFNTDITVLISRYISVYHRRLNSRGKRDTVVFLKQLLTVGERYALYQPITCIPWTASDRDGFPECIAPFKGFLRSKNRFNVILALSVLRSVELLRLPISKDIDSVTAPGVYSSEVVRNIADFANKVKWIKPLNLKRLKYHLTLKNGPNGPALKTSDSDVAGLMKSPELYGAIQTVQEKLGGSYPLDSNFISNTDGITSKLTQFPEKAGKTRTIAIVDYYSQRSLKPLHEALMKLLRSLKTDGTYSHANVGEYAKQLTLKKGYSFCADLTNATDRFPAEVQKVLLSKLIPDTDLFNSLWTLLTKRTFKVAWSSEMVTYNAGQPMGCYASWPLFALAHHLVVEFCSNKTEYRLIGDDFITSDQTQSQRYKEVMEHLGVSINYSKTVESPKGSLYSAAEVAKQLFLNGDNLSPITPGFIRDLVKPHMFNICMVELRRRYEPLPVAPAVILQKLFPKESTFKRVWLLASNPWNGSIKPSDEGYNSNSPWVSRDISLFKIVFMNLRMNSISMKAEMLFSELLDSDEYLSQDDPRQDRHHRNDAQLHTEEEIRAELSQAMLDLNDLIFSDEIPELLPVEYVTDPRDQYKSRKECRGYVESYLVEQVLPELPVIGT